MRNKPYLAFKPGLFLFSWLGFALLPAMGLTQVIATPTLTASSISVSETVTSSSALAGTGVLLFSFPYTASNTSAAIITSVVPPNTRVVAVGPPGIVTGPGATAGAAAGQAVTWTITSAQPVTGTVWMLVSVLNTTPSGTLINNSGEYGLSAPPNLGTNAVTAVVGPNMQIDTTVSPTSAVVGTTVNYNLVWSVVGEYLLLFDSYDNATTAPIGYDGTAYSSEPTSSNATWTITTSTAGDNYILAANPGAANGYMLRGSPQVQLAPQNNFSVAGVMEIISGSTSADVALAMDSTGSNGYVVGLSTSPGMLYLERISGGTAVTLSSSTMTVNTGIYYAISAAVNPSSGGSVTLLAKAWASGQSVPSSYSVSIVDPEVITTGLIGWEDNPANNAAYTDLYLFENNGLVNPVITDTLPTGITFQSATPVATYTAPLLNFSFGAPVTVVGGSVTYSWTGVVNNCGTLNNQASINGSNIQGTPMPQVSSNISTLSVSCASPNTPTPTPSPNGTLTPTPTPDEALYLDSNVFNPNVQPLGMDVRVDTAGEAKILIFNMAGEEVEKLMDQQMTPGNYRFSWDGRNGAGVFVGNGIYFLVIEQPSGRMIKKVVVLK